MPKRSTRKSIQPQPDVSDVSEDDDDLVEDLGEDLDEEEDLDEFNLFTTNDDDTYDDEGDIDLTKWTVTELKSALKARGIKYGSARKAGLVEKLTNIMKEELTILDEIEELEDLEDRLLTEEQLEEQLEEIGDLLYLEEEGNKATTTEATTMASSSSSSSSSSSTSNDRRSILEVLGVACLAAGAVWFLLQSMPKVTECSEISAKWLIQTGLAKNATGLKELHKCTEALALAAGQTKLTACYMSLYIFFQTFAVPGPNLLLSVLAGALFENVWLATLIVGASCTTGAVCCYLLSYFLLEDVIKHYLAKRMELFKKRVAANKDHLMSYMLFLRLTPLLPNWFINLTSPVVGVPVTTFAMATFFGQIPMNLVYWYSGNAFFTALEGEDGGDPFEKNMNVVLAVSLIGVGSLVPVLLKKKIEQAEAAMGSAVVSESEEEEEVEEEEEESEEEEEDEVVVAPKKRASRAKSKGHTKSRSKKTTSNKTSIKKSSKKAKAAKYLRTTTLVANLRDPDADADISLTLRPRHRTKNAD